MERTRMERFSEDVSKLIDMKGLEHASFELITNDVTVDPMCFVPS